VRYQSTKGSWKKAVDAATDVVVVAGGDGTVAKVFRYVAGRDIPVGVLAVGTANNLARSLGLLGDANAMARGWDLARTKPFDVGVMKTNRGDDERRFVEACGGGLLVDLIQRGPQEVEQGGALVGSEHDRALTLLRSLVDEVDSAPWGVEVDGQDHSGDYLAVEAMLIRLTGPGLPLAPQASPGDGVLDVALVRHEDRKGLLDYIDRRLAHEDNLLPSVEVARGRKIVLRPPGKTMRSDDDLVKVGDSVELTLVPAAVRYLVAANAN
jgi:diacylglycerol kinase family enzyme